MLCNCSRLIRGEGLARKAIINVAMTESKFEALSQLIKEECDCPIYSIRAHTNKAVYHQSQLFRAKVRRELRLALVTELAS